MFPTQKWVYENFYPRQRIETWHKDPKFKKLLAAGLVVKGNRTYQLAAPMFVRDIECVGYGEYGQKLVLDENLPDVVVRHLVNDEFSQCVIIRGDGLRDFRDGDIVMFRPIAAAKDGDTIVALCGIRQSFVIGIYRGINSIEVNGVVRHVESMLPYGKVTCVIRKY